MSSSSTLSRELRLVVDEDDNDKFKLERVKPVGTSAGYIRDLRLLPKDQCHIYSG